jgi:hypothetical protein
MKKSAYWNQPLICVNKYYLGCLKKYGVLVDAFD